MLVHASIHVPQLSKVLHSGCSSMGSTVSIVPSMGWVTGVRILARARDISLLKNVQISYGAHPAFQWVQEYLSRGIKWLGCEAGHSPASSTKLNKEWNFTTNYPRYFHGARRSNFICYSGWSSAPLHLHMNKNSQLWNLTKI